MGFSELATTGDVKLEFKHSKFNATSGFDAAWDYSISAITSTVPSTAGLKHTITTSMGSSGSYVAGDTIQIMIYRDSEDTDSDTLSGDWLLTDFYFKYTRSE
jgi:hypothetical protein